MDSANDISGNVEQVHRRKKIRTITRRLGVKPEDACFWKPYAKPSEKNTESVDEFTHPSNHKNGTKNADKIFGFLEPPTVNDSIVHNTRGTLGAKVASREFQRAVLKHTMFDSYHFLQGVKTEKAQNDILDYLQSQNINRQKVLAYYLDLHIEQFKNTNYYVINTTGPDLTPIVNLRRTLKSFIAPMTGMTHTISYYFLMDAWLHLLLEDILPCDALVCTSTAARKVMERTFELLSNRISERFGFKTSTFRGRIETIPLGIDTDYWNLSNKKVESCRLLRLPEHLCILLCAARFSVHDKMDHAPLLVAIKKLMNILGDDSFQLILVGDDTNSNYSRRVRQLINKLGLTHVVKMDTNVAPLAMREYFAAADIFISLSDNLQETFGLTVIQAMACGLPVIVSDWNGYKDTVVHNETGFRVRTLWTSCDEEISGLAFRRHWRTNQLYIAQSIAIDIDKVVEYLSILVKNPELCKRFGNAGRRRAKRLYSWSTVMKRYMDLWDDCRKTFEKMGTFDSFNANRGNLLDPSYFKRFSHYATEILTQEDSLILSDIGFELISDKDTIKGILPCDEMRKYFSPMIFQSLVSRIANGETTFKKLVGEISGETKHSPNLISRHIMWLIKYGILITTPLGVQKVLR